MALTHGNAYDARFCDEPYFTKFVPSMLRLYYEEELTSFEGDPRNRVKEDLGPQG